MKRVVVIVTVLLWLLGFTVPFVGLAAWWFLVPAAALSALLWICFMIRLARGGK